WRLYGNVALNAQLPYSLPGRVGAEDETRRKQGPAAATAENSHVDEKQAEETRCHLKQMGEGKIGKIRIHRSGRVTLVLGDNILDVNSSTKTSYYQQLVSVATDEVTKTTSMINLGQMQHKVTVTPQWEPIVKGQLQQAI
ncbi:DNA-directed RNA polymerase III subunit RPC4, partial [Hyposmocoma kahamanoa]|uniref:DNA-directed RNA polymerase III subunit RPC4 n=1 Tax=Hyposmocoma kahamanoa TaxID=1477025 RepID=UPI000E6D82E1